MLCHILKDFIKTKLFHLFLYLTGDNHRPSAINTAGLPVKLTINIKKMKMNIS